VFSKKLGTKPKPKPVQGKVTKDRTKEPRKLTLQEQMLAAAQGTTDTAAKTNESSLAVDFRNIVSVKEEVPSVDLQESRSSNGSNSKLIHEID